MADIALTEAELVKTRRLGKFIKAWDPEQRGVGKPNPRTKLEGPLVVQKDIAIPVRDGTILRANVYRHKDHLDEKLPIILNYSVYGKDGGTDIAVFPPSAGLDAARITDQYLFEAADPLWWCSVGYIVASVDARGSYMSDGDKSYYSRDVGLDGYDVVEWLSSQEWSNGKVAIYGASGYAMVAWLVAAEQPPSLAAMIPIDGMTDMYREISWKGGIPETQFNELYPVFFNWGRGDVEDPVNDYVSHVYFDEYWRSKIPALERITCPTYIIAGWSDHGLHTRGTMNAYYKIPAKKKYLEIHQYQKWEWSVTEESLKRQRAFLDTFLLGKQTEVQFWPQVRYAMREKYYTGEWRYADKFPPPETEYTQFFPTSSLGLSRVSNPPTQSVSFDARNDEVEFELPMRGSFEMAGHSKLKLWVEVQGGNDLDLFITLRKRGHNGKDVYFPWMTVVDTGPVAFGWQRVSRRELDEAKSTRWQPYHTHQRDLELSPGEIVPVEIEILPTSCRFRPGERLVLVVSGHDYGNFPTGVPIPRHQKTVNQGTAVVHFGGSFDSHLLLPVIPPVPSSYFKGKAPVKMSMVARRVKGWSDEKFLDEYTNIHAQMTSKIGAVVPILRNYTQLVACPHVEVPGLSKVIGGSTLPWDCMTTLAWSSKSSLWGSFRDPSYRATAKSHVFVDENDTIGIVSQVAFEIIYDPILFEKRSDACLVSVMLAGSPTIDDAGRTKALEQRFCAIRDAFKGTIVLRYALNRRVLHPDESKEFFHDTPFQTADWKSIAALEQYWFSSKDEAAMFLENKETQKVLGQLPDSFDALHSIVIIGREHIVVQKDLTV